MRNLLLLHGALGAPDTLQPLAAQLSNRYHVHCPAFPGHGGTPATSYRMDALVDFIESYIAEQALQRPLVFGYSMGGYVALALAARQPALLAGIATLATKLRWTPEGAAQEVKMLDPDKLEQKVPAFASALDKRHAPLDWKEVLRGTAALLEDLGRCPPLTPEVFAGLSLPVQLLLGDRDTMVSFEETREAYAQIPGARFAVLPATPHPLEKAPVDLLAAGLDHFFQQCP